MTTPIDRRCSLTRVAYSIDNRSVPIERCDVTNLVNFADHMREALARIGDDGMTIEEAKRIAKMARMGEEWKK